MLNMRIIVLTSCIFFVISSYCLCIDMNQVKSLALTQYTTGNYDDAIKSYQDITTYSSSSNECAEAVLGLAKCYNKKKDYMNAENAMLFIINAYPSEKSCLEASYMLGYCRINNNEYIKAKDAFMDFINNYPDSSYINTSKIRIAALDHKLGRLNKSLEEFCAIVNDNSFPEYDRAYAQLQKAGLLFEIAKGEDPAVG